MAQLDVQNEIIQSFIYFDCKTCFMPLRTWRIMSERANDVVPESGTINVQTELLEEHDKSMYLYWISICH